MEDDGGSPLTNGVSREIKAAIRKVVQYLESAHGIIGQKVSQQQKQKHHHHHHQLHRPILSQSRL